MLQRQGIKSASVPGIKYMMRKRIIIHCSPCSSGFRIKRTVLHLACSNHRADDMTAHFTRVCPVDQLILRHCSRILVCSNSLRRKRRLTLS